MPTPTTDSQWLAATLRSWLGVGFSILGLLFGSCSKATNSDDPVAARGQRGGVAGLLPKGPFPVESKEIWVTPKGRRIVPGTVDELGYRLPLDVRRPAPERAPVTRPTRDEIAARRASAVGGPFTERRLGPDDGHTQNETSIDVAGNTLIAGWNQFTDTSAVMGAGRSVDRGESWTWELFDGHTTMSDPAVKAAGSGRWFFAYLALGGVGGLTPRSTCVDRSTTVLPGNPRCR